MKVEAKVEVFVAFLVRKPPPNTTGEVIKEYIGVFAEFKEASYACFDYVNYYPSGSEIGKYRSVWETVGSQTRPYFNLAFDPGHRALHIYKETL